MLLVGALALLAVVVWPFRGPLFVSALLAAAFQPVLRRLERALRGRRRLAGVVLTVFVLAVIVAPFAAVVGFAVQQVLSGLSFLRDALGVRSVGDLAHAQLPGAAQGLLERGLALAHVTRSQLQGYLDQALAAVEHAAPAVLAASGQAAFHTVVLLGAFYFLVLDGREVIRWLTAVSPLRRRQTFELLEEFRRVSVATLVGTVLAAVFQGIAAGVGYALLGVPHPAFFGLLTALASFVPVVGTLVVWVPASLLLAATGHVGAGIGLAAWCVVAVVGAEHVGRPLLLGGQAEMHTGLVFLGLLGGIEVFGLLGVLAGPLVIAFFLALARMSERELAAPARAGAGPPHE
ncbi:MAG TPA: AI-2E family transporter [Anaeromyxobacteraceae bacterium]|nr:AI-2E family transporter [Anaeromyxobacteraceae bacterium]